MKLLNLNKYFFYLLFFIFFSSANSEESIDIWKKDKTNNLSNNNSDQETPTEKKENSSINQKISLNNNIQINEEIGNQNLDKPLYGIYDPEESDLNLNMWIKTDGKEIKDIFKRINQIKLSKSSEEFFISTIMTYSYSPDKNLSEDEFLNLKISWLISNEKDDLLEEFLNKNKNFKGKKRIIQYLVDKNISKANLNEGCKKSEFISKDIKDSYLEKFKIYCLIFKDKKNEAQLVFDILKEQGLSNKFFDRKINFLLGINAKPDNTIRDDNLLNFYLSSVTVPNFSYEPSQKTNKFIWEYLNAANLVKIENFDDKEKIQTLEIAANNNSLNKSKIFQIYRQKSFDLNSLINAEEIYKSLDGIDSRALIYQKYLLSDKSENKLKLLFLLEELFKKEKLTNLYASFLSDELKKFKDEEIPETYKNLVEKNIVTEEEYRLGKIKFNDKILHRSRVIRYYTEKDTPIQKSQKDFVNVYKKIKKNRKYFFSAKDLALIESLEADGFEIPKEIKHKELAKKYSIPSGLNSLIKDEKIGLLALKFVEIIGEDEISDLDPETVYFITHLLNKANLLKFRNQVLITALPLRS